MHPWFGMDFPSDDEVNVFHDVPKDASSCKYCSASGLSWKEDGHRGWRLFNADGTRHGCAQFYIGRKVTSK